jgi:hypothetical protein
MDPGVIEHLRVKNTLASGSTGANKVKANTTGPMVEPIKVAFIKANVTDMVA